MNPRHAGAYANLLILFNTLGEYDKALECGRRSLAAEPDSADVLLNLATAELGRTQREGALRWLGDLLAKSPDNILASACAWAFSPRSIATTKRAPTSNGSKLLTPRDTKEAVQKEDAIATLLLAEGRYEDGIAALDRAIALDGEGQDDAARQARRHDGDVRPTGRGEGGVR